MENSVVSDFVKKYYPDAKATQDTTGVPALVTLSQAALESAWGRSAPGNMFFGKKDNDGINGNEQLLTTSEYLATNTAKFPQIISIQWDTAKKLYHYVVKDYFRKYDNAQDCFTDHAKLLSTSKRYEKAMEVKNDPYAFATQLQACGYATDPQYAQKLHSLITMFKNCLALS